MLVITAAELSNRMVTVLKHLDGLLPLGLDANKKNERVLGLSFFCALRTRVHTDICVEREDPDLGWFDICLEQDGNGLQFLVMSD